MSEHGRLSPREACAAVAGGGRGASRADLGELPQWRLEDLYEGMDSPRFAADLARAAADAAGFAARLSRQARRNRRRRRRRRALFEAVARLRGAAGPDWARIMSYASLLYAGDTSDAARGEILWRRAGEDHRARRRSPVLRARAQSPRRRASSRRRSAVRRSRHYRPWLEDIRKERPHQLSDEIEQLFLEKSVTGVAAWNRLFDDTSPRCASTSRARS